METRNFVTVTYLFLTIYSFSGGGLLGIVDYPIWKLISTEDFPAFHRSYFKRVSMLYVPFFFLSVLVNIVLIWIHPPAMSTTLVVIAAALNFFIWVVTATLAIPIHKKLNHAKSAELIDRLVTVHLYLRFIPGLIVMVVTALLLCQVLRASAR